MPSNGGSGGVEIHDKADPVVAQSCRGGVDAVENRRDIGVDGVDIVDVQGCPYQSGPLRAPLMSLFSPAC